MLPLGLLFIFFGLPLVALGVYFRKEAVKESERLAREKEKTRSKKDKKSKRSKKKTKEKERNKDQAGKERGTSGGISLILGGGLTTLIGVGFLVKHFLA